MHQSNICQLQERNQLDFVFYFQICQMLYHNLQFDVYLYLLELLRKFCFFISMNEQSSSISITSTLSFGYLFSLIVLAYFFIQYMHVFMLIPKILPTALPLFPSIYNFIACFLFLRYIASILASLHMFCYSAYINIFDFLLCFFHVCFVLFLSHIVGILFLSYLYYTTNTYDLHSLLCNRKYFKYGK